MLEEVGVIAYALPAHASGSTQPLDVAVFSPFKEAVRNRYLSSVESWETVLSFNDVALIITDAYDRSFTRLNGVNYK